MVSQKPTLSLDSGARPGSNRKRIIISVIGFAVAIHLVAALIAGVVIVAKYLIQPPATFVVKRDLRMPVNEREHRMNMAEFDALTPKPSLEEKIASLRPTEFALPDVPEVPFDQMLPLDPAEIVSDQVASMVGAEGLGTAGLGSDGLDGHGSGMSFFGIKDSGRSVLIMVDVSNSMFTRTGDARGSKRLKAGREQSFQTIRDEAAKLIEGLGINSRFGIIKWGGGAYSWKHELVPATDANKQEAARWLQDKVDFGKGKPKDGRPGGTRHDYALEKAFKLEPEVIYMLTDGNATASQKRGGLQTIDPEDIWKVAAEGQKTLSHKARLHVIYYVTGADKDDERKMLRTLASRNGGKFRQVKAESREN